jgi:hypothetical protein
MITVIAIADPPAMSPHGVIFDEGVTATILRD